jgi:hypothetical protein
MMLSSNPYSAGADPPFANFNRIALGTTVGLKLSTRQVDTRRSAGKPFVPQRC